MKRCACGAEHETIATLPRAGTMTSDGEVLLLANCPCGSTLATVLVPHREDVLARLGITPPVPEVAP